MKKLKTFLTILPIFLVVGNLKAQTYPLSDFVERVLSKPNSPERDSIYQGGYDFEVSVKRGKLKIKEYEQKRDDEVVELWVGKGSLVGTDEGEWGGELRFVDEADNTTVIKKGNIRFLFKYRGEIYFIESLAHMSIDEGALFKVVWVNGAYSYIKIFDFDDAPRAMCIVDGDILVASLNHFYRIHDLKKEKIFPDLLADDFLPTSIVATDNRHIYMGVTAGYIKIDLTNNSYSFYQYKKKD